MRVLVVHNRYSSRVPSGENLAVDDEVRWLRERGRRRGPARGDQRRDRARRARSAGRGTASTRVWSLPARRRFLATLDGARPDVVHLHNLFPLLTGSVPRAAAGSGACPSSGRCTTGGCAAWPAATSATGRPATSAVPAGASPASCTAATRGRPPPAPSSPPPARCSARRPGARASPRRHQPRTWRSWLATTGGFDAAARAGQAQRGRRPDQGGPARRRAAATFLFLGRLAAVQGAGAAARRLAAGRRSTPSCASSATATWPTTWRPRRPPTPASRGAGRSRRTRSASTSPRPGRCWCPRCGTSPSGARPPRRWPTAGPSSPPGGAGWPRSSTTPAAGSPVATPPAMPRRCGRPRPTTATSTGGPGPRAAAGRRSSARRPPRPPCSTLRRRARSAGGRAVAAVSAASGLAVTTSRRPAREEIANHVVLVVHNNYSSRVPSGENLSVHDEVDLAARGRHRRAHPRDLQRHGGRRGGGRQAPAGRRDAVVADRPERFDADLDRVRPDVVHVHNLFPLLTASVPWAAVRADVPLVWTCHNRRLVCVEGTNYRDGAPCHLCRPGWRVPGMRHGCYQRLAVARGIVSPVSSAVASGLVTISTSAYRGIARRHVTALGIADNVRRWLVEQAGFAPERVRVKFNGVPGPDATRPPPPPAESDVFLFAGQLADYKGLPELLAAWRLRTSPGARLRIVGDGMCAPDVEAAAAADPRITFVGPVPPSRMAEEISGARVIVAPSTTPETFGRVAAEALAYGRPVITIGAGGPGRDRRRRQRVGRRHRAGCAGPGHGRGRGGRRGRRPQGRRRAGPARRAVQPAGHHRGADRHLPRGGGGRYRAVRSPTGLASRRTRYPGPVGWRLTGGTPWRQPP